MTEEKPAQPLGLTFSASGSEYFRIWVVNLLLIVVTLGFYMPFAKARRLQYFYSNTVLDGQALSFHGDPWRMLRGYVLMLVLFGGYALSGHFSPWAAFAFFLLLAVLWPALWRSSMRFRLHNTSWRGLRFGFAGTVADAYRAMLPLFVPGVLFVAANAWYLGGVDTSDQDAVNAAMQAQLPVIGLGFVLLALLLPYSLSLIKRYQHQGYRYANQEGQFSATTGDFFKLGLKAIGVTILGFVAFGLLAAVAVPALMVLGKGSGMLGSFVLGLLFVAVYVALISMLGAYFTARLQNLCWNATRSQNVVFRSQLQVKALSWLTMKNFCLTVITLGLYRPFAVVNTMALRLGAVQVLVDSDIDTWNAGAAQRTDATSGEMAGDFFGIDMGL